ncbi:hypothetical protein IL992_24575 [Microbispora sp. NEAU-D428]|uniref:hypothetical protein n=1 Tax=Microbispora sitophila TaxID=2771537 RepID=UPI0018692900|nr:hypothetical protein [Microbispora sitophila]MBE3012342.1 hypothetical protein [Microbispora sitophila]
MDLWGTVLVLFRRWYVVLPTFVLCIGATLFVYTRIPVTYTSQGIMLITIPTTGASVPDDPKLVNPRSNPLVTFDYGLNMTASLLIQALGAPEMGERLGVPRGGDVGYKVTNGSTNPELMMSGPFVFVEAEAPDPKTATALVAKVMAQADVELTRRQKAVGAPPKTFLTITHVVEPTTPEAKKGSRSRAAAAAVALSLMGSLTAAFAVESFVVHRRARRRPTPGPERRPRVPAPSARKAEQTV